MLTAILLASSFTMQFGVWAIRRGDTGKLRMWTAITLVLGVLFLMGQLYDYSTLGFGIADGLFGTFYTLTGFHGAHVFGGTVGLTILHARASGQFSAATTSRSRRSACTGTSSTWSGSPCSARSTCCARGR